MINIQSGVYSHSDFAQKFLAPLFATGVISEYPGTAYYAICYGELCAYDASGETLLATWSKYVPDCESDVVEGANYRGKWVPYND